MLPLDRPIRLSIILSRVRRTGRHSRLRRLVRSLSNLRLVLLTVASDHLPIAGRVARVTGIDVTVRTSVRAAARAVAGTIAWSIARSDPVTIAIARILAARRIVVPFA